jgi:phage/plasmid primase-like uncharacterized protein
MLCSSYRESENKGTKIAINNFSTTLQSRFCANWPDLRHIVGARLAGKRMIYVVQIKIDCSARFHFGFSATEADISPKPRDQRAENRLCFRRMLKWQIKRRKRSRRRKT